MMRRTFLMAGVSLSAVAVGKSLAASVFLDYTQEQLDTAYDQSFWAPRMAELEEGDGIASAVVRRAMPPRPEKYGPDARDLIDVFAPADAKAAPVLVFIHGGAWTRNTREDASYPAPTFVSRGAAYAAPDFGSVKTLTLPQMVENCRRAVEWTMKNAASFGGDPNRVYVAGHSSGAHLAACVLITDWTERSLPADALKGGLLMSGMYDLYPVMLSSRSSYLHLTEGGRGGIQPDAPSRPDHLPDCRRVSRPGQSGVQAPVRGVR
ncbi:MAG: alpha/beta hydrolase [Mesorhizobium sp.]|nr:MAG: alpha/beta hydrolase [Mesorhizobium sp.]